MAALQGEPADAAIKDSKMALKARLSGAQAQSEQQAETIKRLRVELAAANERLALQGAHFMEQMRRLGTGTLPTAGQARKPVGHGARQTLTERVAHQQRSPSAASLAMIADNAEATADNMEAAAAAPNANSAASSNSSDHPPPHVVAEVEPTAPVAAKPRLIDRISNINKA